MKKEDLSTKEKILETAAELFSKFGFAGTSIRDISKSCGVNISAISYYFGGKSDLYWTTLEHTHIKGKIEAEKIIESTSSLDELLEKVFNFLLSDIDRMRTSIKLALSDGMPEPTEQLKDLIIRTFDPLSTKGLEEMLIKEIGGKCNKECLNFASASIFGQMLYYILIHASSKKDVMIEHNPELKVENVIKNLKRQARASIKFIQENKSEFLD